MLSSDTTESRSETSSQSQSLSLIIASVTMSGWIVGVVFCSTILQLCFRRCAFMWVDDRGLTKRQAESEMKNNSPRTGRTRCAFGIPDRSDPLRVWNGIVVFSLFLLFFSLSFPSFPFLSFFFPHLPLQRSTPGGGGKISLD